MTLSCVATRGGSPDAVGAGTELPTTTPDLDAASPLDTEPSDGVQPLDDIEGPEASGAVDAPEPEDVGFSDVDPPDDAQPADGGPPDEPPAEDLPQPFECPPGVVCVGSLPFEDSGDTVLDGAPGIDSYACKESADESGPEVVYRLDLAQPGFLSAAVFDDSAVDVDVHILTALDGQACLGRGDRHAAADVPAGVVYVVIDSYVSGGDVLGGAYTLQIGLIVPSSGSCAMQTGLMKRVGDGGDHLEMPATGPIVLEAHLVTQDEPTPYPAGPTDELAAHYALSQAATGLVMHRTQNWAPLEGGSFYGAGIGSPNLVPVVDEGWYVNMYWTSESRPPRGTRMILRLPGLSRAVVVSAGHETGPGNLDHIGGTPEETHFYLRTGHLDTMTLGLAVDPTLPLGPRECSD